jgi:hypothetical protein
LRPGTIILNGDAYRDGQLLTAVSLTFLLNLFVGAVGSITRTWS